MAYAEFYPRKNIMRLSDGRCCPRIGDLMILIMFKKIDVWGNVHFTGNSSIKFMRRSFSFI